MEAAICELRRAHPRWGQRRLHFELGRRDCPGPVPSLSTIYRVLVRHGPIDPVPRRRRREDYQRWQRERPMELWQLDIVGGAVAAVVVGSSGRLHDRSAGRSSVEDDGTGNDVALGTPGGPAWWSRLPRTRHGAGPGHRGAGTCPPGRGAGPPAARQPDPLPPAASYWRHTVVAHVSAALVSEAPSPTPGICVAIATGCSLGAENTRRRNVPRHLARGGKRYICSSRTRGCPMPAS